MRHNRVLLLTSSYEPIEISGIQKAINLIFTNKGEVLEVYPKDFIRTAHLQIPRPAVVKYKFLNKRFRYKPPRWSKRRIYFRDKGECQYCGKKLSPDKYTLDHIIPKRIQKIDSFENLVLCCQACNLKKGDKTLKESGLKLIRPPRTPSNYEVFTWELGKDMPNVWEQYLIK